VDVDERSLQPLEWRLIGAHRGGRVVAVAGDSQHPMTFYFGACAGGVWKTSDGGTYWENVSDSYFHTAAVGAIAVADSDPNVIYAGMGESCIRVDVSHGDGVYKSTDGGRTWAHLGLEDTRHIARIRIDPHNPDLVYVAALGHAFGPNKERGVYRTRDGGKTWDKILFRSVNAGAIDLSLDPSNPRILFAAIWEARRTPWSITSGGPDSSLYASTDGGDSWIELTNNPGLPRGSKGRIAVAVSRAKAGRVWALVEAQDGGLFRSDNAGSTWERVNEDARLRRRPWYFSHIFADPQDPERIYVLSQAAFTSTDGGRTFTELTTPHVDNHDLWIDPREPTRMIEGNDGGACVSFNRGASWSTIENQPTAEFYHLAVDNQFPYRVYGTQQDNSAISVPSRSNLGAIRLSEAYPVGSSESGHIAVRPDDANIVYSGAVGSAPGGGGILLRYDHRSGEVRIITVWPEATGIAGAKDLKYRFQWTYPIALSPHNPNVLFSTGNHVFRSADEGTSWEMISPDLTRNDATKMEASGGPITQEGAGADVYGTIFAFAESPHERGVFWAGSDDGLLHLSRDGGMTWNSVTPPDLPEWTTINTIEPSPHDPAAVYVSATRYKLDDTHPYLYKTKDYGKTWQIITNGIPADDFTRVIREDPIQRGLLYAGTETGLYISFDDGAHWLPFRQNLPVVPVYDLAVKDGDLIAATHGRSFWILDDLTPLRQMAAGDHQGAVQLFRPRPTYRVIPQMGLGYAPGPGKNYGLALGILATYCEVQSPTGTVRRFLNAGTNPPDGVIVTYSLYQESTAPVTLTFLDHGGRVINSYGSEAVGDAEGAIQSKPSRVPAKPGTNRFVWDMRWPAPPPVVGDTSMGPSITLPQGLRGPLVPPGSYQVRLTTGGEARTEEFEIIRNPRLTATQADLDAQFALLVQIYGKLADANDAVNRIRETCRQFQEWDQRTRASSNAESVRETLQDLVQRLSRIEEELFASNTASMAFAPARLTSKLVSLVSVVASSDSKPTVQSTEVFEAVAAQIDDQLGRLEWILADDVPALNARILDLDVPVFTPPAAAHHSYPVPGPEPHGRAPV